MGVSSTKTLQEAPPDALSVAEFYDRIEDNHEYYDAVPASFWVYATTIRSSTGFKHFCGRLELDGALNIGEMGGLGESRPACYIEAVGVAGDAVDDRRYRLVSDRHGAEVMEVPKKSLDPQIVRGIQVYPND